MTQHIAIYPGSFDPITLGHLDIIQRSLSLVDLLIIGIGTNPSKKSLFSFEERLDMTQESLKGILPTSLKEKVKVLPFDGLLVDFAKRHHVKTIIRGLRAISDFEYEFQMAAMNRKINATLETIFLMASDHTQFIASRFVKEIALLGGDIHHFVTPYIEKKLQDKVRK